jgi:uncharacterized membrane protein
VHDNEPIEGRAGVGRVEAFSDGVLAIIVTIMVLELHAPEAPGVDRLLALWPTLLAYALSYAYVAIYWVNHHRLFSHVGRVTGRLLWIPFSTAYLGLHHFSVEATQLYLLSLLLPSVAYSLLHSTIRKTGHDTPAARLYLDATGRKGLASSATYTLGFGLSLLSPWLGVGCAAVVAIFWILPWGPLDAVFVPGPARRED